MPPMASYTITNVTTVCGACPTIFDFSAIKTTKHGKTKVVPLYFRLRHGHFRVCRDDTDKILVSGPAPSGIDGVCDIAEAIGMARFAGLDIAREL